MNQLLRQAVTEQQRHNFTQAHRLYTQFLEKNPNNAEGLFLFGLFLAQQGDLSSGLDYITKSIQENPQNPDAHYNQAVIYIRISQLSKAKESLAKAISLNPQSAEAHFNLALILLMEKNHHQALEHLDSVLKIKPSYLEAIFRRGLAYLELKQIDLAIKDFNLVLSSNPHHLDALLNSGVALQLNNQLNNALQRFELLLQLNPNWIDALLNQGVTLSKLKRFEDALTCFDKAILQNPNDADLWSNKGITLSKIRKYDEANACLDKAIQINPSHAEAWTNKGNNYHSASQFYKAIECFDRAIEISPNYAEAWSNKGVSLSFLKEFDRAIACYEKAIELDENYLDSRWNLAITQLTTGNFLEGWKNYEYRWHISNPIPLQFNHIPRLTSLEELNGRKLLIWHEQGLGDTLQFCRYIPLLQKNGAQVSFLVQQPLEELLRNSAPNCQIITDTNLPSTKFDLQSALLSLPRLFVSTSEPIPQEIPYLKSDPIKSATWKGRLDCIKEFKVGIVWNGGFRSDQPEVWSINERRNIPFEIFSELRHVPKVAFFSLQKGEPAESDLKTQRPIFWPESNFYNYASELHNFSDTAALIDNLDLVISVDTSTAHLAGAMGKPVWILNRFDSCWRWQNNREDTPWYPTAKLFHQQENDGWKPVMEKVKSELISVAS